jgi:hypothetical protein
MEINMKQSILFHAVRKLSWLSGVTVQINVHSKQIDFGDTLVTENRVFINAGVP